MKSSPDYRLKWIKIWPHAWFDSSMRVELSNEERAFWVDLLALAGKMRQPGIISSGRDSEGEIGYPLTMLAAQLISWTPEKTQAIIEKLRVTDRITIRERPLLSGETGLIVSIVNWEKWQSESQRVRKYRQSTTSGCNPIQPDGVKVGRSEVEVEGEGEGEKEHSLAKNARSSFSEFWAAYPSSRKVGKPKAETTWKRLRPDIKLVLEGLQRWKGSKEWADPQFIPYPTTFLNQRRWEDIPMINPCPTRQYADAQEAAVASELRVGKAPDAHGRVRPEALERIRKREEARAALERIRKREEARAQKGR